MTELSTEVNKARLLYDQDILLWVEDTVTKLKARDFANLDLDNLIEEVESLGISQRKELLSRLVTLLEHILKRMYVDIPNDYNGWERTIRNQRVQLELLFKDAPSLKTKWDNSFIDAWQVALKTVRKEYRQVNFPDRWSYPADIETILDRDFWEEDQTSIK
jgi:hypothetical protein